MSGAIIGPPYNIVTTMEGNTGFVCACYNLTHSSDEASPICKRQEAVVDTLKATACPKRIQTVARWKTQPEYFWNFPPSPPVEVIGFTQWYTMSESSLHLCGAVMWCEVHQILLRFCNWTIVAGQPDGTSPIAHGMSALAPLTMHKFLLFPEHKREVGLLSIFLKVWLIDWNQIQALKHTNHVLYRWVSTTARLAPAP